MHRPDPAHLMHTRQVLEATLGMEILHRRARKDDLLFASKDEDRLAKNIDRICELVTGDIREDARIVHHCRGCCNDEDAAAWHITNALVEAGLLYAYMTQLPSKSRWGSTVAVSAAHLHASAVRVPAFLGLKGQSCFRFAYCVASFLRERVVTRSAPRL
eukprot:4738781-Lingulodinium_polyedra.AAC.1